jgi:hypothetical protein
MTGASSVDLKLPFTLVACDGCGPDRAAGARCLSCGSTTIFDDRAVDRRRRIVDRARPLLDEPGGVENPISLGDAFKALGSWITRLLRSCARVMDGTEDEAVKRIGACARALRAIEDRTAATPRTRDDAGIWDTIDGVPAALRGAIEEYLAALSSKDPAACQEHAVAGQRSIDAAGHIAGALGAGLQVQADKEGFLPGLLLGWAFGRRRP